MKKNILRTLCLVGVLFFACSCEQRKVNVTEGTLENITFKETEEKTDNVKIVMDNDDIILLELYPTIAPITVENFQKLISEKFYDGLIYHRVIKNFMIQTGDPEGTGMGGSKDKIKGEFRRNGVDNNLKHDRGVISMARQGNDFDSASSQFFICHKTTPSLDGDYAAFGRVIAGLDVVDKIATVETDSNDKPLKTQKIKTIRFVEITKE